MRFKVDREKLFAEIRSRLFKRLRQEQVAGIEFLISKIETVDFDCLEQAAYLMATVQHETAGTFQPVKERRERANSPRRANQDRYWLSGYYGRGYVQITWKRNYERAGREIGVDLVGDPDLALRPDVAFQILYRGMMSGWFTSKKLSDYINSSRVDFVQARRVVNGLDRAQDIAALAERWHQILRASLINNDSIAAEPRAENSQHPAGHNATTTEPNAAVPLPEAQPQNPEPKVITAPPPTGFISKLKTAIAGVLAVIGGAAGVREWLGLEMSDAMADIIKTILPLLLILAFISMIVWYISEKVIGWKTLRLQAEINSDPSRNDLIIRKHD